jgi:hypothetical protein
MKKTISIYEVHELTGNWIVDDKGRKIANESAGIISRHTKAICAAEAVIFIKNDTTSICSLKQYEIRTPSSCKPVVLADYDYDDTGRQIIIARDAETEKVIDKR